MFAQNIGMNAFGINFQEFSQMKSGAKPKNRPLGRPAN
jgi:hypothetical protein